MVTYPEGCKSLNGNLTKCTLNELWPSESYWTKGLHWIARPSAILKTVVSVYFLWIQALNKI